MKPVHVILSTAAIGAIVLVTGLVSYSQAEPIPEARFTDVSIIGEGEMAGDSTVIREGHYATITLDVEKISDVPIKNIMVRTYLTNTENGDFLLIDNSILIANLKMTHEEYLVYNEDVKPDPFGESDRTGILMINVSTINAPENNLEDTVNVVLYADGIEVDRMSFDVLVKNKRI